MTRPVVKFSALAASVLVALSAAGCAEIPRSSQVKQGPDIRGLLSNDYLYYSPSGPVEGETKGDILAGFLNASTGPQNDYGVARQYLTPAFKAKWSPNDMVYIQSGPLKTKLNDDGTGTVTISVAATVDATGQYRVMPAGSVKVLNFRFLETGGQWRIADAPNAVVMIRPVFDVIFHSYPVYFFDRSYNYLVPDLRWFPARASTATRLVFATLNGPAAWLEPAVVRTMPQATGLAIDSVTVESKTATVNLDGSAAKAGKLARQRFKSQLEATLSGVNGINKVSILIENVPQSIPDFSPSSTSSGAYAPIVLEQNQLQQLVGPSGGRLSSATSWISKYQASDFAVSADQTGAAIVGPGGVYLGRLDQKEKLPTLVDTRKSLLSPRFDRRGQLWLLGRDGALHILMAGGRSTWPTLPVAKKHSVKAFAVSPEGARIAYVVRNAKGAETLRVAAVIRNQMGEVTGFGTPIEIPHGVGNPASIAWSGKSGILVLSTVSESSSNLTLLTLGGDPREIANLERTTDLMASDDGTNIYVLDAKKQVKQYRGYTWIVLSEDVIAAHMVD